MVPGGPRCDIESRQTGVECISRVSFSRKSEFKESKEGREIGLDSESRNDVRGNQVAK